MAKNDHQRSETTLNPEVANQTLDHISHLDQRKTLSSFVGHFGIVSSLESQLRGNRRTHELDNGTANLRRQSRKQNACY